MGWSCNIEEVLRILTPELVLFTLLIYSLSTTGVSSPLSLELLLDGIWKLNEIDWIRGENSQEEWSFLVLLVLGCLGVWNDHVMHWLLIMFWG